MRTFKVSCSIPNSIINGVSILGNEYTAQQLFPTVVDQVVETLEESKLIKRVRARVYRTDTGYMISSSIRTEYPEDVVNALYDECVYHVVAKELKTFIGKR